MRPGSGLQKSARARADFPSVRGARILCEMSTPSGMNPLWSCCATCNKSRSSSTPRPRSRPRRPVALSTLFVTLAVLHTSRLLFLLVRASPERVLQEGVNFNMRFYAPHGLGWYSNATVQCERGVQPRARPSHKTSASPALAAMRLLGAGLSGLYHGRPPSSSSVCRGLQNGKCGPSSHCWPCGFVPPSNRRSWRAL